MTTTRIGQTISITVKNEPWIRRNKFEIPAALADFFPKDALGARGKPEQDFYPEKGMPVEFDYGIVKSVCDLATKKNGVMRPRENGSTRRFYEAYRIAVGDILILTCTGDRKYRVEVSRSKPLNDQLSH